MTRPSVLFRLSRFLYLAYYFTVSTWIFQRTFLWNFMMFREHDIEQFIVTQRSSSESIRNQSKPQPRQWMDIWISIYLEIRSALRCYLSAFYFRSHLEKNLSNSCHQLTTPSATPSVTYLFQRGQRQIFRGAVVLPRSRTFCEQQTKIVYLVINLPVNSVKLIFCFPLQILTCQVRAEYSIAPRAYFCLSGVDARNSLP